MHSAGIKDRVAARAVLMRLFCQFDSIATVFVDGGYTGKLIGWAKEVFGYNVEVVKRNEPHTSQVLPRRWIVERPFAWLAWSRRLILQECGTLLRKTRCGSHSAPEAWGWRQMRSIRQRTLGWRWLHAIQLRARGEPVVRNGAEVPDRHRAQSRSPTVGKQPDAEAGRT